MPELPEVETIKRGLQTYLVGHSISDIQILDPLRFTGSIDQILGSTIQDVHRRGKGLLIHLDNGYSLAIHVKMTGQLIYRGKKTENLTLSNKIKTLPNPYTRVVFHLDKGAHLYYNDVRRFGWIKVIPTEAVFTIPFFKSLGPEPFGELDNTLTIEYFTSLLEKNRIPIKSLLLDQQKIAGVGNIYANDALYVAKIDPRRPSNSLKNVEISNLFDAIHEVMKFSIDNGAASDTNYVDALGQDGRYQDHFKVYGRVGGSCDRCGAIIKRIVIAGRGTFICPVCQK
jgi:formamidopyrimidine-DNA glycosylase